MPFLTLRRFRFRKSSQKESNTPEPEPVLPEPDPLAFNVSNLVSKPAPKRTGSLAPKRTGSVNRSGSLKSSVHGERIPSESAEISEELSGVQVFVFKVRAFIIEFLKCSIYHNLKVKKSQRSLTARLN